MHDQEEIKELIIEGMTDAMMQLDKGILLMGIGSDKRVADVFFKLSESIGEEEAYEQMLDVVQETTVSFMDENKEKFNEMYAENLRKLIQN